MFVPNPAGSVCARRIADLLSQLAVEGQYHQLKSLQPHGNSLLGLQASHEAEQAQPL
jgi:hypothetical protein